MQEMCTFWWKFWAYFFDLQRAQDESTGLWAYGYQRGTDALSQAGKNLYNAYAALTDYLGYTQ